MKSEPTIRLNPCRVCREPTRRASLVCPDCIATDKRQREARAKRRGARELSCCEGLIGAMSSPRDQAFARKWLDENPATRKAIDTFGHGRIATRTSAYQGFYSSDWLALVVAQRSRCAICETFTPALALNIDHDHETGQVRGLLCMGCNTGLGHLGIDGAKATSRIFAVLEYIENRGRGNQRRSA